MDWGEEPRATTRVVPTLGGYPRVCGDTYQGLVAGRASKRAKRVVLENWAFWQICVAVHFVRLGRPDNVILGRH